MWQQQTKGTNRNILHSNYNIYNNSYNTNKAPNIIILLLTHSSNPNFNSTSHNLWYAVHNNRQIPEPELVRPGTVPGTNDTLIDVVVLAIFGWVLFPTQSWYRSTGLDKLAENRLKITWKATLAGINVTKFIYIYNGATLVFDKNYASFVSRVVPKSSP